MASPLEVGFEISPAMDRPPLDVARTVHEAIQTLYERRDSSGLIIAHPKDADYDGNPAEISWAEIYARPNSGPSHRPGRIYAQQGAGRSLYGLGVTDLGYGISSIDSEGMWEVSRPPISPDRSQPSPYSGRVDTVARLADTPARGLLIAANKIIVASGIEI